MKRLLTFVCTLFLCAGLTACSANSNVVFEEEKTSSIIMNTDQDTQKIEENYTLQEESSKSSQTETTYTSKDLKKLKNTKNLLSSTIEHIFMGTINRKGNATGYHYDGIEDSPGEIISGTKTKADENGIYEGQVKVDGIKKSGNKGYSTFYPESYSPQDVIVAINVAYEDRELVSGNTYRGETNDGFVIEMYLNDNDKIISAFPIYEG